MPSPRRRRLPISVVLFRATLGASALVAAAATLASDASAAWPPPESATPADLKDPANWPNDPGYGFRAGTHPNSGDSGQWNFFSFLPDRSGGTQPVRAGETASGMSIDMAWRYTTGDSRVKIAVLDSGIKWDEDDLLEKAFINTGELANHKPQHGDGSACGGTGDLAGYDCNDDGVLTISDYKDTPSLTPAAAAGHPLGDRNNNGKLDAGDLILNYSDGIDDDGNGYVDDISGWDFMKDDNDPYDDTRYGHGTGEANDSTGAGNNGIGEAGVCPQCRFVPLRVGDSFIADVQNFAQAVVYASDNGVSVIQEALGTIDNTTYTKQALDYAWSKGLTVIASMADENSRHHNLPAVNNHTLPTHAIAPGPSEDATTATTFLQFNLCTNYGAQNFISASSTSCSSGATGTLSGITGLIYSAGLKYLVGDGKAQLSPSEVQQLIINTTDDINVPESQTPGSGFFWSQPGFDQRFGYGRANAGKSVQAIKDGKIPPQVDIVSPEWFEILYKDKVNGPVPLKGTVSAPRATSYDYKVEVGAGVQPLDSEFHKVGGADNIPGTTVTGGDTGDLGALDLATIDLTHTPDPDSTHHENDYTFTVRVSVTAHYGGAVGDVHGELRRAYYIYQDPDLLPGFPIRIGASGESSPKLADIDGDGVRDIVLATADGVIHAYTMKSGTPAEVAGFPAHIGRADAMAATDATNYLGAPAYKAGGGIDPAVAGAAIVATPAVGDLDGDGKLEIVVTSFGGTIGVIGSDGQMKAGWPVKLPYVPSCPLDPTATRPAVCTDTAHILDRGAFASPVLADMDKDGKLDIIQAAFDGRIYVYKADGSTMAGWPVLVHYTGRLAPNTEFNRVMSTPAVTDFNGDGWPDLVVGSNEKLGQGGQAGAFYLIDGRGNAAGDPPYLTNWPVTVASLDLFPVVAEGVPNSPIAADFDGDGKPDAIMHGNVSAPLIVKADPGVSTGLGATPPNAMPCHEDPFNPGGPKTSCGVYPSSLFGELSTASRPNTMLPLFAMPSAGDIDMDGTPDVVASGGSLNLAINLQAKGGGSPLPGDSLLAMWSGKTGKMLPGSPMVLEDFTFFNSQAIADMNGDGYPEVLTGSGGYYVHAFDGCGREPTGWPKFTGQWVIATVAVGDVDGDHNLEAITASRAGWLYAWRTKGKDDGVIQWESFHHDNANTGYLGTKLDQGKAPTSPTPLDCAAVIETDAGTDGGGGSAATPAPEAEGDGCGCRTAGTPAGTLAWLPAIGLAALAVRRRRARRAA